MISLDIALRQPLGRCKGVVVPLAMDCVFVTPPDGQRREVGFVHRAPNAMIHFVRFLDPELRAFIRDKVSELRDRAGLPTVHPLTSSVPNPRLIRAYLNGDLKKKKRKTVYTGGDDVDEGHAAAGGEATHDDGRN